VPTRYFAQASSASLFQSSVYGVSILWLLVRYLLHRGGIVTSASSTAWSGVTAAPRKPNRRRTNLNSRDGSMSVAEGWLEDIRRPFRSKERLRVPEVIRAVGYAALLLWLNAYVCREMFVRYTRA